MRIRQSCGLVFYMYVCNKYLDAIFLRPVFECVRFHVALWLSNDLLLLMFISFMSIKGHWHDWADQAMEAGIACAIYMILLENLYFPRSIWLLWILHVPQILQYHSFISSLERLATHKHSKRYNHCGECYVTYIIVNVFNQPGFYTEMIGDN